MQWGTAKIVPVTVCQDNTNWTTSCHDIAYHDVACHDVAWFLQTRTPSECKSYRLGFLRWSFSRLRSSSTTRRLDNQQDSAEAAPLSSTRLQSTHRHPHQLTTSLPVRSRNNILRAFPHSTINDWNSLPADLFSEFPTIKKLQSFKTKAYYFLRSRDWQWATSTL